MYTARNIAFISIATSLLFATKYAFGMVAGIEFVTFLVVLYGAFFPLAMSMMIVTTFVLLTGVVYGMGYWWIMYWFIFPTEAFLSWIFRKQLDKNNVVFATWAGFWGFSIMFWYALQDLVMQGAGLAIANMTTAIITNTIEAASNFIVALFAFYPCKALFKRTFKEREVNLW